MADDMAGCPSGVGLGSGSHASVAAWWPGSPGPAHQGPFQHGEGLAVHHAPDAYWHGGMAEAVRAQSPGRQGVGKGQLARAFHDTHDTPDLLVWGAQGRPSHASTGSLHAFTRPRPASAAGGISSRSASSAGLHDSAMRERMHDVPQGMKVMRLQRAPPLSQPPNAAPLVMPKGRLACEFEDRFATQDIITQGFVPQVWHPPKRMTPDYYAQLSDPRNPFQRRGGKLTSMSVTQAQEDMTRAGQRTKNAAGSVPLLPPGSSPSRSMPMPRGNRSPTARYTPGKAHTYNQPPGEGCPSPNRGFYHPPHKNPVTGDGVEAGNPFAGNKVVVSGRRMSPGPLSQEEGDHRRPRPNAPEATGLRGVSGRRIIVQEAPEAPEVIWSRDDGGVAMSATKLAYQCPQLEYVAGDMPNPHHMAAAGLKKARRPVEKESKGVLPAWVPQGAPAVGSEQYARLYEDQVVARHVVTKAVEHASMMDHMKRSIAGNGSR